MLLNTGGGKPVSMLGGPILNSSPLTSHEPLVLVKIPSYFPSLFVVHSLTSLVAQLVKNPPVMWETWVRSLGWVNPLEKGKATHSSIVAWRIPWTVKSLGSQRVRHNEATFTFSFQWLTGIESACQCRRHGFQPCS